MKFLNFLSTKTSRKVPEVIIFFWIIKLLTTAMGESTSDYLVHTIEPVIAVAIGGIAFLFSTFLQFKVKKYIPYIYWLNVTMVAVFGTMGADVVHIVIGVPYLYSTIFFAISLFLTFIIWKKAENTLSIHSIYTPRREIFYWLTVVVTFALGTAAGDMTAITLGLGYFSSGILFGLLFAIPFVFQKLFKINEVLAFWFAYIVTRPLGASFADWFGKTKDFGGLGIGTGTISIILGFLIIIFVVYMAISKKDIKSIGK